MNHVGAPDGFLLYLSGATSGGALSFLLPEGQTIKRLLAAGSPQRVTFPV